MLHVTGSLKRSFDSYKQSRVSITLYKQLTLLHFKLVFFVEAFSSTQINQILHQQDGACFKSVQKCFILISSPFCQLMITQFFEIFRFSYIILISKISSVLRCFDNCCINFETSVIVSSHVNLRYCLMMNLQI